MGQESTEWFLDGQAFLRSYSLAPCPPLPSPPPPGSKLDRRHTRRLKKGGNLLTGEGGARRRIIRPQESLALYKPFNPLWAVRGLLLNCLMMQRVWAVPVWLAGTKAAGWAGRPAPPPPHRGPQPSPPSLALWKYHQTLPSHSSSCCMNIHVAIVIISNNGNISGQHKWLNKFEALLFVWGYSGLEEDWVCPELCVEQRVVAVHPAEEVDASVPLLGYNEHI